MHIFLAHHTSNSDQIYGGFLVKLMPATSENVLTIFHILEELWQVTNVGLVRQKVYVSSHAEVACVSPKGADVTN